MGMFSGRSPGREEPDLEAPSRTSSMFAAAVDDSPVLVDGTCGSVQSQTASPGHSDETKQIGIRATRTLRSRMAPVPMEALVLSSTMTTTSPMTAMERLRFSPTLCARKVTHGVTCSWNALMSQCSRQPTAKLPQSQLRAPMGTKVPQARRRTRTSAAAGVGRSRSPVSRLARSCSSPLRGLSAGLMDCPLENSACNLSLSPCLGRPATHGSLRRSATPLQVLKAAPPLGPPRVCGQAQSLSLPQSLLLPSS